MRKNVVASHWVAGVAGFSLGGLGTALGVAKLALGGLAVAAGLPVAAAAAAASYGLYRLSYRGALRGMEKEIRLMLQAVGGNVRAAQVFGAPPPIPPAAPRQGVAGADFLTFLG
jgi:hypothetical protein